MAVNYDDERFTQVEAEKQEALTEIENTYGEMIDNSDSFYQAQIDASKEWAEKQSQLQQEQTDFAIEKVEQQKEQAHKDYLKEQSGAYVDWQKQSNQYGVEAEKMASAGLSNTGYSETSQVSMYNQYQNRVATARDVYMRAVLNYDNAIKDARLQNNAALAEIAYQSLMQELQLGLEGFQYKNSLILEKADKKLAIDEMYHARWQDVLNQINTENALAEEQRQFNAQMAQQSAQLEEEKRQFDAQMAEEQRQFNKSVEMSNKSGSSAGSARISGGSGSGGSTTITGKTSMGDVTIDQFGLLNTPYYRGLINLDCQHFGTFSNGYQPKGITGHGKLTASDDTLTFTTEVKYGPNKGQKPTLTQTIWVAEDGTRWYWEGRQNKYLPADSVGGGGRSF